MPAPSATNTNAIRGYTLAQMQQLNYTTSQSLQNATKLNADYGNFLSRRDGEAIAQEITNRLADYTNAANKQMHCDARKWMNQEVNDYGRVGFGRTPITGQIQANDRFKLVVEYNTTGRTNEKHFWNLKMRARVPGGGIEQAQVAHFTMYSDVDRPIAARRNYTILGAFHLKDNLAQGTLTAAGVLDPALHSEHAAGIIPATARDRARITQSFRRYFIRTVSVPGRPAVPATETTPLVPAVPPTSYYEIGLQEQKGNVSEMTARFGRVAVEVMQEYFDANFSTAGFTTAANPTNFRAEDYCRVGAVYRAAADTGATRDIAEPSGATARAAARTAAIASGLIETRPANLRRIAAAEDAAEAAARLTALRAFPIIGGKRATRRRKSNKRYTRKK